jgi:hypothetical protein
MELGLPEDLARLHHAYLVEGDATLAKEALLSFVSRVDPSAQERGDILIHEAINFLLDEAKHVVQEQSFFGVDGGAKYIILIFSSMTIEAQNSLLKTLEEPTAQTHFFLLVPLADVLLPTLRSRMISLHVEEVSMGTDISDAEKFLASSVAERLRRIEPLISTKGEERKSSRNDMRRFVGALESVLTKRFPTPDRMVARSLGDLILARRYSFNASSSPKILLGHLAVTLPVLPPLE